MIVRGAAKLMYRPDCLAQTAQNSSGSLLILIHSSGDFSPTFLMLSRFEVNTGLEIR